MSRKENHLLTEKIIKELKKHPEGTFVSEIARDLGLSKSTISYILNTRLKEKIHEVKASKGRLFRVIRLK